MRLNLKPKCATIEQVDAERDRRFEIGFPFNGKMYQARLNDQVNFNGAFGAATLALSQGAQPGDYRWSDPNEDFQWIAADNSKDPFDAQTTVLLAREAMIFVAGHIHKARALKDRIIAGEYIADPKDDIYWQ